MDHCQQGIRINRSFCCRSFSSPTPARALIPSLFPSRLLSCCSVIVYSKGYRECRSWSSDGVSHCYPSLDPLVSLLGCSLCAAVAGSSCLRRDLGPNGCRVILWDILHSHYILNNAKGLCNPGASRIDVVQSSVEDGIGSRQDSRGTETGR